jgi:hypothetical protein
VIAEKRKTAMAS